MTTASVTSSGDERILRRARAGQRQALAELIRGLQDSWYRFCVSMLGDVHAATDAVQETAMRFCQRLPTYKGQSHVRTWSLGIALNVCREMQRARSNSPGPLGEQADAAATGDPSPEAIAVAGEQHRRVRALLEHLAPRQREAVVLRYFEQLSVEQTADAMGCAPGTVKATVSQAIERLRQLWSDPS